MILTEEQRLDLKTKDSASKLYVSIYKPNTLLACRVNDADIFLGATEITFDGVTSGSYSSVEEFVTVLVGTSPGKGDVGKIWARSATSSVLTVGMNTIDWEDDLYITVLDIVEIWNRPFSLSLEGDEIEYSIDGDTTYPSEAVQLGTLIDMGANRSLFAGDSLYWNASGSVNVYGNSVWYEWEFEGGDIPNYSGTTPGNVLYDTAGFYKTKLTAHSSNGMDDISYRYVAVHDRTGDNAPYTFANISGLKGSREEGSWVADIVLGIDSVSDVYDGAIVNIFAEHWLDGEKIDYFKNLFSGYIIEKTINYDYKSKTVEFNAGSPTEIAKYRPMTALSVDSAESASAWTQVTDLDTKKFLYYYMKYFSTISMCADISANFEDRNCQFFTTLNDNLYENLFNIINSARLGNMVCNREGKIYFELEPEVADNFASTVPSTISLEDSDYMGVVSIYNRIEKPIGFLEVGGFSYSGSGYVESTPFLSDAQDTSYVFYGGKAMEIQGLAISGQDELNTISGNVYAHRNAKYPEIEIQFSKMYLNFDIAPLENIPMSVSTEKNNAGIDWNEKDTYIRELNIGLVPSNQSIIIDGILHEVTDGADGETLPIEEPPLIGNISIVPPEYNFPALTPIGGFTPTPHVTPNPIEPVPGDACPTTAPPNGAYSLYLSGIINGTTVASKQGNLNCRLRTAAHDNRTTYVLYADFQKWDAVEEVWETTEDDDFYTVEAIGDDGNVKGVGVPDPINPSNLRYRTGKIDGIVVEDLRGFRIRLNDEYLLRPSDVTNRLYINNGLPYGGTDYGEFQWWYKEGGIRARVINIKHWGSYGFGAGGARSPRLNCIIQIGASSEYIGKTFEVYQRGQVRMSSSTGDGNYYIDKIWGGHWTNIAGTEKWKDDTNYYIETPIDIGEQVWNMTPDNDFREEASVGLSVMGIAKDGEGVFTLEVLSHTIDVYLQPEYRIVLSNMQIYNVCPPTE